MLFFAAALMAGVVWHFAAHKSVPRTFNSKPSLTSSTISAASASPAVAASTNSLPGSTTTQAPAAPGIAVTLGDIQFIPREKITAASVTDHVGQFDMTSSYEFYRVGRFVNGAYKGAELLMAFVSVDGDPCKGEGCGVADIVRYIQKGNALFPLPKISDSRAPDESVGRKSVIDMRPLKALGVTSAQALDLSVPILEYPATLVAGPRAVLHLGTEGVGSLDSSVLQVAFRDPLYGDVWTTKPEVAPQKASYQQCSEANGGSSGDSGACADLRKYADNAFYFFRPDGTYLSYVYEPDFRPEDPQSVTWNDGPLPAGASYQHAMLVGCSGETADAISVVSSSLVSEADLKTIGKVNSTGDLLYGLKNKNHPLYKEFYADYDSSFPTWLLQEEGDHPSTKQLSYDKFLNARPLFLWRDPFGKLIRFVSAQFLMPQACEPILYLYPRQKEIVEVKLGESVAVTNSYPSYQDGWLVSAQPDGEMADLRTGRRLPYLFWEGHSYILPMEPKGFVVKSADVPPFLDAILPKLGLNAKEAGDFISAWSSRLTEAPYYFITFLDKSVVDRYYPLQIDPLPDTTIRVFMDFSPLSEPIAVQPPLFAPPPQRHGFTVVEWGVLVR